MQGNPPCLFCAVLEGPLTDLLLRRRRHRAGPVGPFDLKVFSEVDYAAFIGKYAEGRKILSRYSLLSLLLLLSIVFVGARIHQLWEAGPWDLPNPAKVKKLAVAEVPKKEPAPPQLVSAKNIVEKNLFDPERGASQAREREASSIAMQRVARMVLVGTAILGNSRYAILQEPSDSRPAGPRGQAAGPAPLRLKLGDTLEGFRLSEVHEKKVVFTKGASRVEIVLDFSRKVEGPTQTAPALTPSRPPAAPRAPQPQPRNAPAPQPAR